MADKDKDKKPPEQVYSGTKQAADKDFAEWICRQWARDEHLDKIDVVEYFPKGQKRGFGENVGFQIFQTAHEVNLEEAIELSNHLHGCAVRNCERIHEKEMTYYARAFDRGRESTDTAIDTFPLKLRPRTQHLNLNGDSDETATPQSVALDYLKEGYAALKFDRQREDNNIADLIAMFIQRDRDRDAERKDQRLWEVEQQKIIRETLLGWVQTVREHGQLLSADLDRAPARELMKIKAEMLRDGWKSGKNILTGLLGGITKDEPNNNSNGTNNGNNGHANGNGQAIVLQETRMTQERMLIDNFFGDCKDAKIDDALFGKWEKAPGQEPHCTTPGIFNEKQFMILIKVLKGVLTADALDDLMPGSGKSEFEVTMDQLRRAQELEGMTDGIAVSFAKLVEVRREKIANRNKASATSTPPATNTTATDITTERDNDDV